MYTRRFILVVCCFHATAGCGDRSGTPEGPGNPPRAVEQSERQTAGQEEPTVADERPDVAAVELDQTSETSFRVAGTHTRPGLCEIVGAAYASPPETCEHRDAAGSSYVLRFTDASEAPAFVVSSDGTDTFLTRAFYPLQTSSPMVRETLAIGAVTVPNGFPSRVEIAAEYTSEHVSAGDDPPDSRTTSDMVVVCDLADPAAVRCTEEFAIRGSKFSGDWNDSGDLQNRRRVFDYALTHEHDDDGVRLRVRSGRLPERLRDRWQRNGSTYLVPLRPGTE